MQRAPGQWPADVRILSGFRESRRRAFIAVWPDRIELYHLPHAGDRRFVGAGLGLAVFGALIVATVPFTDGGLAENAIFAILVGLGLIGWGLRARPGGRDEPSSGHGGPSPDMLDQAASHTWPRDVPIAWGHRIAIHAEGGDVILHAATPHRRGLRAMLES